MHNQLQNKRVPRTHNLIDSSKSGKDERAGRAYATMIFTHQNSLSDNLNLNTQNRDKLLSVVSRPCDG